MSDAHADGDADDDTDGHSHAKCDTVGYLDVHPRAAIAYTNQPAANGDVDGHTGTDNNPHSHAAGHYNRAALADADTGRVGHRNAPIDGDTDAAGHVDTNNRRATNAVRDGR